MRAYMPDVLASLKCHMDVQASDGHGMLLRYVAGYDMCQSFRIPSNCLDDVSSDYALARRVLAQHQPLEPEMRLQLGAHLFQQCFAGGGLSRFVAPVPCKDDLPERVQQYMTSSWRPQSMTLLTYLRKTNQHGGIHREYKKTFAAIAGRRPVQWGRPRGRRHQVPLQRRVLQAVAPVARALPLPGRPLAHAPGALAAAVPRLPAALVT